MTAISIVFASRGRPASLAAALRSLYGLAGRPGDIEAVIAVDPDDADGYLALPEDGRTRFWTAPERYGYTRLHDYLNRLARQAQGEWLMWFNDDMRMRSAGWDQVVRSHRPAVLWPLANHAVHANIAPVWPRAWADALGHASPTTHMDTYLQRLGEALGRHDQVPVEILHDRADLTGAHQDQTYAEGRERLGPEGMAPGWDEAWFQRQVAADAEVIRGLL